MPCNICHVKYSNHCNRIIIWAIYICESVSGRFFFVLNFCVDCAGHCESDTYGPVD